jgi:hypothetical protein
MQVFKQGLGQVTVIRKDARVLASNFPSLLIYVPIVLYLRVGHRTLFDLIKSGELILGSGTNGLLEGRFIEEEMRLSVFGVTSVYRLK